MKRIILILSCLPLRGFTKYVAIIEGFIGWFMLSVFIVSLLSQMMSV
ncbi:hypothetical protein OAB72_00620 [Flavobacteriales bacterium]|nr:hypothetical protein [Flavobacteriales bacterium]